MDKHHIKQKFLDRDIVENEEILDQYLDFCFDKNQNQIIRCDETKISITNNHHILPRRIFPFYKNLNLNKWNGTHLYVIDHLYVHFLLAQALKENNGMLTAFSGMIKRHLSKDELLKTEFEELVDTELVEGLYKKGRIEQATQQKITKSEPEWKDSVGEEAKRKEKITKSDPEWIDTVLKEQIIKQKETKNKVQLSGFTIAEEIGLKNRKIQYLKGKWFNIFNDKGELIYENIPNGIIHFYCQALLRTSIEKPIGSSNLSKSKAINNGNKHLIGHYIKEVHPSEEVKIKQLEKEITIYQ